MEEKIKMPLVIQGDDGIRPAGNPNECFYCRQKIGQEHKEDCAVVTKEVIMEYSIQIPIRVPYHWDEENMNFHKNGSSWCANNAIREVWDFIKKLKKDGDCLCDAFSASYVETSDPNPRIPENEKSQNALRESGLTNKI